MTKLAEYLETRDKIIRPALEELKKEYERQGYQCSIGFQGPPRVRSIALSSQRGVPQVRSVIGPVSFSRKQPNSVTHTVSIYTWGGNSIIFYRHNTMSSKSVLLDDITPDRVKEEVRRAFR